MGKYDEFKNSSTEKINKLKTEFELLKAEARNSQADRKEEIAKNLEKLEELQNELEEKYTRVENFGDIAAQELSDAFFSSTAGFEKIIKETKDKLK
jgi:predicted RNase H-like nuclease (RuvC/YqgF family)